MPNLLRNRVFLLNHTLVLPALFTYFIDPISGSDANGGTSPTNAFLTAAPLTALGTLPNNTSIGIRAGTTLSSWLDLAGNNISVSQWGAGARPILDCRADIASASWVKTAGQTYTYQAPMNLPAFTRYPTKHLGNFWIDDAMVLQVDTLALCDSTPNSFYVPHVNEGVSGDVDKYWNSANSTLYYHPGNNGTPQSAAARWRYSSRPFGVSFANTGVGGKITNIRGIGNAHADGSIVCNCENVTVTNCRVDDGARHAMLVGPGAVLDSCEFYRGRNDIESSGTANSVVCFSGAVNGKTFTTKNCVFDGLDSPKYTGLDAHGATGQKFGSESHTNNTFRNMFSLGVLGAVTATFSGASLQNITNGFSVTPGCVATLSNMTGDAKQLLNLKAGATANVGTCNIAIPLLGDGFIVGTDTTGNATVNLLAGNTWSIAASTAPADYFLRLVRGNVTYAPQTFLTKITSTAAIFSVNSANTAGTGSTLSGSNSIFPIGSKFILNGITRNTLAEMQAASLDTGSTYPALTVTTLDNFNTADTNLETLAGWARIGGAAAQIGVRSNQLAIIGTTQTAYVKAPDMASGDGYARAIVAGVPATAGPFPLALRIGDAGNWVAMRWSGTQYQAWVCIGGASPVMRFGSTGVSPTVGDEIILAVKGDLGIIVINKRAFSGILTAPTLLNNVKAGAIARSSALNPALDDFSFGPLT